MLEKSDFYCAEQKKNVMALIDRKHGNCSPMTCTEMLACPATTFCRFVNPLTTRVPLRELKREAEVISA